MLSGKPARGQTPAYYVPRLVISACLYIQSDLTQFEPLNASFRQLAIFGSPLLFSVLLPVAHVLQLEVSDSPGPRYQPTLLTVGLVQVPW